MIISILQLSDIHFKNKNNSVLNKTDKIFDAIKNEIDDSKYLFIVFTGDIAFSGRQDEYQEAKLFITQLKTLIEDYNSELQIEFIFTAGNHDCDFSKNVDVRNMIIKNIIQDPKTITPELVSMCTSVQVEYDNFIQELHSSQHINDAASSNLFIRYEYDINTYKIAFNAYNLAWASKRKESQSEIIYPANMVNKDLISNENYDITISLFHHPLHWLQHQNIRSFKELINSTSNIVMTGHEHTPSATTESIIDKKEHIEYLEAGVLQDSQDINCSSFNLLNINLDNSKQNILEFGWDSNAYTQKRVYSDIALPFTKKLIYPLKDIYKRKLNTLGLKVTHPTKDKVPSKKLWVIPNQL